VFETFFCVVGIALIGYLVATVVRPEKF